MDGKSLILEKNSTIAVAAPAGQIRDKRQFFAGIDLLAEMGFLIRYPRELWPGQDYLAASDQLRGQELNKLFADPEVGAIVAARGGFGSLKTLEHLDLEMISQNRKPLLGFSDISILINYLGSRCRLPTLHGPSVSSLAGSCSASRENLARIFRGRWSGRIEIPRLEIIREGHDPIGPLWGGNLASLASVIGTSYDISWEGGIIVLEDLNEPLYKVDRLLSQLRLAGKFKGVKALLLGDFTPAEKGADELARLRYQEKIWQLFYDNTDSSCSIWARFPCGHGTTNIPFPLGDRVRLVKNSKAVVFRKP